MFTVKQVLFLVLAVTAVVTAQNNCPVIFPRGSWSTRSASFIPVLPIRPAPFVVFHPTQQQPCASLATCSPIIRDIQTFHIEANGWPDISYHFLIGADYRIYEGRGWGRVGVNVDRFSNQAINVGLIGGFSTSVPSVNATNVINEFINCGISVGALAADVTVLAQCQVTNMVSCEATTIFQWLSDHSRFVSNPRPV